MDEFRLQVALSQANTKKYPGISDTPLSLGKRPREDMQPEDNSLLAYT
jgi:hypothetical protein